MSIENALASNPVIAGILSQYPASLSFTKAAAIIGCPAGAAYTARARGTFPLLTRQLGKRLVVFTADIIKYLETGESQASLSVGRIKKTYAIKTGRPTKREELEAKRRGLSVKELRAQQSIAGV